MEKKLYRKETTFEVNYIGKRLYRKQIIWKKDYIKRQKSNYTKNTF